MEVWKDGPLGDWGADGAGWGRLTFMNTCPSSESMAQKGCSRIPWMAWQSRIRDNWCVARVRCNVGLEVGVVEGEREDEGCGDRLPRHWGAARKQGQTVQDLVNDLRVTANEVLVNRAG